MIDDRIKDIARYYGFNHQYIKAIEELNELGMQLAKSAINGSLILDAIEEIADVEIMLEQIKYLAHISENDINEVKEYKIQRQLARMEDESRRHFSKA